MELKTFGCALDSLQATTITIELSLDKGRLTEKKFAWATGYYAASVDGEDKVRVDGYIRSQEARHAFKFFI